jgi:hypothetical protein
MILVCAFIPKLCCVLSQCPTESPTFSITSQEFTHQCCQNIVLYWFLLVFSGLKKSLVSFIPIIMFNWRFISLLLAMFPNSTTFYICTTRKSQATATSWHAASSTQASMKTKVIVLTYLSGTTLWLQRGEPEQCRQKVWVWLKFSLEYVLSSCMSTAISCLTFSWSVLYHKSLIKKC